MITGCTQELIDEKNINDKGNSIMYPNRSTLIQWIKDYENAPKVSVYKAIGEVLSITKRDNDQYEVVFSIKSIDKDRSDYTNKYDTGNFSLKLKNELYPDSKFLKKYKIILGNEFECYINVITSNKITKIEYNCPSINIYDINSDF
jgi:hypothetical protein